MLVSTKRKVVLTSARGKTTLVIAKGVNRHQYRAHPKVTRRRVAETLGIGDVIIHLYKRVIRERLRLRPSNQASGRRVITHRRRN